MKHATATTQWRTKHYDETYSVEHVTEPKGYVNKAGIMVTCPANYYLIRDKFGYDAITLQELNAKYKQIEQKYHKFEAYDRPKEYFGLVYTVSETEIVIIGIGNTKAEAMKDAEAWLDYQDELPLSVDYIANSSMTPITKYLSEIVCSKGSFINVINIQVLENGELDYREPATN